MKLKSTGQPVHHYPWTGDGKQPWPKNYMRILVPLGFRTKKRNRAAIQFAHLSKLDIGA